MKIYGRYVGDAGYGIFINGKLVATSQNRARIAKLVLKLQG